MLAKYKKTNYTEKMAKEMYQCSSEYMKVVRRMPKEGLPITRVNIRRFAQVRDIDPLDIHTFFLSNIGTLKEGGKLNVVFENASDEFKKKYLNRKVYFEDVAHQVNGIGNKIILLRAQRAFIEQAMEILDIPEGKK